jgi:hypothetical protein
MPANFCFRRIKRATWQGASMRFRPRAVENVRNNIMLQYTVQVSHALAPCSLLKRSERDEVDRGMGERVARRGRNWWRVLRTSGRSNSLASRQRLAAKPQVHLAKRESCSTPKYAKSRRCARELHASRRTKLELQRPPANTRTRTHTHSRTHSRTHAHRHATSTRSHTRTARTNRTSANVRTNVR